MVPQRFCVYPVMIDSQRLARGVVQGCLWSRLVLPLVPDHLGATVSMWWRYVLVHWLGRIVAGFGPLALGWLAFCACGGPVGTRVVQALGRLRPEFDEAEPDSLVCGCSVVGTRLSNGRGGGGRLGLCGGAGCTSGGCLDIGAGGGCCSVGVGACAPAPAFWGFGGDALYSGVASGSGPVDKGTWGVVRASG